MFLFLFCLNGLYVLEKDMQTFKRVIHMCHIFKVVAVRDNLPPPNEFWLYVGAIVNCWCMIFCAVSMYPSFIIGDDGIKDIVFDALAITFLFNLDDSAGDLSFLRDKWDEDMIGDIYGRLADEDDIMRELQMEREANFTADNI